MSLSVFIVCLVINGALAVLNLTAAPSTIRTNTTAAPPTPSPIEIWIYIGIGAAVVLTIVGCQSICFCLYIRKLRLSSPSHHNINATLISHNDTSEDRYQRAPSRVNTNTPKPEQNHSSSLYEYECIKDIHSRVGSNIQKKPEPPPTSTLPKRERPPLPIPKNAQSLKSSTLASHTVQQMLQQSGRQVSTVPSKPPVNFNAPAPMPSRSSSSRRLLTPVRTPVLNPRDMTRNDKSSKIYESLPDLRECRLPPKPPPVHPPIVLTSSTPIVTPNLNRVRKLSGTGTPSPVLPHKPRMPLPQENYRNDNNQRPPAVAPPPLFTPAFPLSSSLNRPRRVPEPGPESISSELMEKLKKRAALTSQNTNTSARSPTFAKPPAMPPPRVTPKPTYDDDSSDEEWTIEEINQINMYNV